MAGQRNRFTIYDAMERAGVFDKNPANPSAKDDTTGESTYKGPVPYPKMLYHPKGEERVVTPAEIVVTPMGPLRVNEHRELIHRIVYSEEEERQLLEAGWHDHPAKAVAEAMKARGEDPGKAPPMSAEARIRSLEAELARMKAPPKAPLTVKTQPKPSIGGGTAAQSEPAT